MKYKQRYIKLSIALCALILIIMDTKTAASGVLEGIDICLKVLIPSLFPFFIVTTYLNAILLGSSLPGVKLVCKKLHIPSNCEFILPLGLMGGYPVGAKLITDTYNLKKIDKRTSQILLGYCNNAGPAFIFGIAGAAFASPFISIALWLIHIASAIITGLILPKPNGVNSSVNLTATPSLTHSVKSAINASVSVCGWIITFKILLSYLNHWFPVFFTTEAGIILKGILELSNGCLSAAKITNQGIRFIVYAAFFGCGGICVYLQTLSVAETIGIGLYTHGKVIQTCISLIASLFTAVILFREFTIPIRATCLLIILSVITVTLVTQHAKKVVAIT